MKILMISDVYFPRINGVSTSIMTYRAALEKAGHDVTLLAPRYSSSDQDEPHLWRMPARRLPFDREDRLMKLLPLLRRARKLKERRFDIIHIQTPFVAHYAGVRLAHLLQLPCVESYHTFFEEYFYHYIPFLPKSLLRWFARRMSLSQCGRVNGLVVPSQAMLDVLRGYGVATDAAVIPTGLDLRAFAGGNGQRFRQHRGIGLNRPTMVHVGRVAFEKNIDFLLQVVQELKKSLPQILLIIAGDGPAVGHLKKLAATLNVQDNCLFIGYLDRKTELLDCYKAGDVFVFSSRTETQGLVLLEAMALGVPVVSLAEMGTKDILNAQLGSIIAPENVADFSAKVKKVLTNPLLREHLSEDAKLCAQQWSQESMTHRMVEFYHSIAGTSAV